ncbi:uncharacterized protein TRIADDRAFT_54174 [Trichoplax adhaerens]|uniref:PX domain-containing protein n=1 Tax=Trichoplax adhaerens TaxID=10228 RepID=B3RRB4_TRIAD|nr:hypothetical protein TRIADDRAFT_54174 [Trichoplax adhaerens]EDV26848.1 hypothetical protein TRIADDRAFT_54174 [Trichoplax adhaerens]|eukprot:XP_002110844.1 hypothetical protein TRIADDRAFT_54174 [Trichoplax adhaerens]
MCLRMRLFIIVIATSCMLWPFCGFKDRISIIILQGGDVAYCPKGVNCFGIDTCQKYSSPFVHSWTNGYMLYNTTAWTSRSPRSPMTRVPVAYAIEIVEGTALQIIEKRYSEFLDLHKSLKDVCRNLPKFPKRTLMKNNPKVVETRRKLLEIYLQDIVSRGDRKINAVLHEFLGIGSKSRSNSDNNYILSGM